MKNSLLLVLLTPSSHHVLFSLLDVKMYEDLKSTCTPIMEGQKLKVCLCNVSRVYLYSKLIKRKTIYLGNLRLGHVGYHMLKAIMKKFLKELSQLEV